MVANGAAMDKVTIDHYGPRGRSPWLDVDWREHQRWVTVAGAPVNLVDLGSGPAVVFVHGLAGSWQNWLENLPEFARDHRVIALDLPGFGHSPMPADRITITRYAAIVDELLASLGVDDATIVGNSMGGFVALDMALRHARRVRRLVLVAAAGVSRLRPGTDQALSALRRAERLVIGYNAFLAARSDLASRRAKLRRHLLRLVAAHPEQLPAPLVSEQLRANGTAGFIDAIEALTTYPIEDRLPAIAAPTLIVWGERDRLVPVGDATRLHRAIPNARGVIYADTGHVPMLERPQRFNADLRAFLTEA
ncbi:alpha/beta fold hydrolase [Paraconexibacter sp.]|uniref:alpha/beta fold hydrolase n=1 Tax=Paraconexibacter sp. TaxID=2949640 RepID=UPI003561D6A1